MIVQHKPEIFPQYSPHEYFPVDYGTHNTAHYATSPYVPKNLPPKDIKHIQSVMGSFLYYARVVDVMMLPALNHIGTMQKTEHMRQKVLCIMDYAAIYRSIYRRYYTSHMVLHTNTDVSYLVLSKTRSWIVGCLFLKKDDTELNALVHIKCKTTKYVVSFADEAETSGVFANAQKSIPSRTMLMTMHHPQPPTPIKTDNTTYIGHCYKNIQLKG